MKVLPKILAVMEFFSDGDEHAFHEVISRCGLARPNASHLLEALCREGVLVRRKRGVYAGGERLARLGGNDPLAEFRRIVRSSAIMVRDMLDELAVAAVRQEFSRITVAKIQPERCLQVSGDSDPRYPTDWYGTGNGRVLLACAPRKVLFEIVNRCGFPDPLIWKEAASMPKLEKELSLIRKNGYSRMILGGEVKILSIPVSDAAGEKMLSLSTAFPLFRHPREDEQILEKLFYCGTCLEKELQTAGIRINELQYQTQPIQGGKYV